VGFIVDTVALVQDFIPVFVFSLVSYHSASVQYSYPSATILCLKRSVKILLVVSPAVL
jgi:hypothetical protein